MRFQNAGGARRSVGAAVVLFFCGLCHGGLLGDFQSQYPAVEADLHEAYSHVRMQAVQRVTGRDGPADFLWKEEVEFLRDGQAVMARRTCLESTSHSYPAKSVACYGGVAAAYFDVFKLPGRKAFTFQAYGARPDWPRWVHSTFRPIYAAYCIQDKTILEYLTSDTLHVVSVKPASIDGQEVVEVATEMTMPDIHPDSGIWRTYLYFQPKTWLPVGWVLHEGDRLEANGQFVFHQTVAYASDSHPPKITYTDFWIEQPVHGTAKCNEHEEQVSSVEFGPIPPQELTLASLGVTTVPVAPYGVLEPEKPNAATTDPSQASGVSGSTSGTVSPPSSPAGASQAPSTSIPIEIPVLPSQNGVTVNTGMMVVYGVSAMVLIGLGVWLGRLASHRASK